MYNIANMKVEINSDRGALFSDATAIKRVHTFNITQY